ncbi:MAG: HdeD family acid-resistance protein [Beijerinckiaceae bacterium]
MTLPNDPSYRTMPPGPHPLGGPVERLRHRWGWFVGFGALAAILGLAALVLVVSATIASVVTIAIFIIITGGVEIAMGFGSRSWGRFFLFILLGLLYVVAGAFALAQPLLAAAVLTLMLGWALLATGAVRIWLGTHLPPGSKAMVIIAGIATALFGLVIILGWPGNSFFVLGIILGLDLLFYGSTMMAFGLRLKNA